MERLNSKELEQALVEAPGWELAGGKLSRVWVFMDFIAAMRFVDRVAEAAETAGHHPDIDIRYNRVTLGLVTHDVGGITKNDADMATILNELWTKFQQ